MPADSRTRVNTLGGINLFKNNLTHLKNDFKHDNKREDKTMVIKKDLVVREDSLTAEALEGLRLLRISEIDLSQYFNAQFESYYKVYKAGIQATFKII